MVNAGPDKPSWRWRLRQDRAALSARQRERVEQTTATLIADYLRSTALPLAGYMACGGELRLDPVLADCWRRGAAVWLPRVITDGSLAWHPVVDPLQLRRGAYRIREPDPRLVAEAPLPTACLLVVPGLGFGRDGGRLGQGGGYYDRLLASAPTGLISLGVGFACQLVDDLPLADHDRRVSALIIDGQWLIRPDVPTNSTD